MVSYFFILLLKKIMFSAFDSYIITCLGVIYFYLSVLELAEVIECMR